MSYAFLFDRAEKAEWFLIGKLMQLMHDSGSSRGMQSQVDTQGDLWAENAHNDINQCWAAWDSGSAAPPDYKALWQTPARRGKGGAPSVCVYVSLLMHFCVSVYICIHV